MEIHSLRSRLPDLTYLTQQVKQETSKVLIFGKFYDLIWLDPSWDPQKIICQRYLSSASSVSNDHWYRRRVLAFL